MKTCSDLSNCDELLGAFATHVQKNVIEVLDLCANDLSNNPNISLCTARLRRFVPAWMQQHAASSYGFRQDNRSYLAAQTAPARPTGMMNPPAELMAAFPERAKIEQAAQRNGWPYLTHDSGLGGVRTFVTIADPMQRFEQWMVVGLDAEAALVPSPAVMSFIAVEKKAASGADLKRVRLHFRDYLLTEAEGAWKAEPAATFDGKCYACHGSGMRQLIPTHESVAASAPVKGEPGYAEANIAAGFGLSRLASLNERLLSYGLPDWDGSLEPADHGPPLGQALGCTACHNGTSRGVITVSTSEGMLRQKVLDQLSMRSPHRGQSVPDERAMVLLEREKTGAPPLSAAERSELDEARAEHLADYQALVAERFPAWRAWLLDAKCE